MYAVYITCHVIFSVDWKTGFHTTYHQTTASHAACVVLGNLWLLINKRNESETSLKIIRMLRLYWNNCILQSSTNNNKTYAKRPSNRRGQGGIRATMRTSKTLMPRHVYPPKHPSQNTSDETSRVISSPERKEQMEITSEGNADNTLKTTFTTGDRICLKCPHRSPLCDRGQYV